MNETITHSTRPGWPVGDKTQELLAAKDAEIERLKAERAAVLCDVTRAIKQAAAPKNPFDAESKWFAHQVWGLLKAKAGDDQQEIERLREALEGIRDLCSDIGSPGDVLWKIKQAYTAALSTPPAPQSSGAERGFYAVEKLMNQQWLEGKAAPQERDFEAEARALLMEWFRKGAQGILCVADRWVPVGLCEGEEQEISIDEVDAASVQLVAGSLRLGHTYDD